MDIGFRYDRRLKLALGFAELALGGIVIVHGAPSKTTANGPLRVFGFPLCVGLAVKLLEKLLEGGAVVKREGGVFHGTAFFKKSACKPVFVLESIGKKCDARGRELGGYGAGRLEGRLPVGGKREGCRPEGYRELRGNADAGHH